MFRSAATQSLSSAAYVDGASHARPASPPAPRAWRFYLPAGAWAEAEPRQARSSPGPGRPACASSFELRVRAWPCCWKRTVALVDVDELAPGDVRRTSRARSGGGGCLARAQPADAESRIVAPPLMSRAGAPIGERSLVSRPGLRSPQSACARRPARQLAQVRGVIGVSVCSPLITDRIARQRPRRMPGPSARCDAR